MGTDYIPDGDGPFLDWATNFHTVCSDNKTKWSLPAAELTTMGNDITDFGIVLAKCHSEAKTKADTQDKNDKREALEASIRSFVNGNIRENKAITNADKVRLGVTVPQDGYHPVPVTTGRPELHANIGTPLYIILRYREEGSKHWGKPDHVHGIEVRHEKREDDPEDWEDLKYTVFDTGGSIRISFKNVDAGKRVVLVARWEMGKVDGERSKGPWGAPIVVHVPG